MGESESVVGRYRLERVLGQGAMGAVYLALDPEIERHVAIKVIRSDSPGFDERKDEIEGRFLKEAKISGRLQHPNIVTIYDVGRDGDTYFIAMEFVEGRPLSRLLRPEDLLSRAQKISAARQISEALAHAHERGVIHRDVKPGNVMVRPDGVVKVTDFGIGKLLSGGGGADLTRAGQMIGSPSYMSPEQIRGETLDGRADLFSLGVVLYEMFTGERPFPGTTVTSLVYQILNMEPKSPLEIRADLPPALVDVLRRLLAKKREERYPDGRALGAELRRLEEPGVPASALPGQAVPVETAPPGPGSGSHPSVASGSGSAPMASSQTIIVEKRTFPALLLGVAALLVGAAAVLFVVLRSGNELELLPAAIRPHRKPPAESTAPAAATPSSSAEPAAESASPASAPASTASVPAPKADTGKAARSATGSAKPVSAPAPKETEPATAVVAFDHIYQTRRGVKFRIKPDQARISIDGFYVGIADDWDDRGGGKIFPFKSGTHHVVASLPGYKDLNVQIVVNTSAGDDVSVEDEMTRQSEVPFKRIASVDYSTLGGVIFSPDMKGIDVLIGGKSMGPAVQFTAAHMLELPGPVVYDVVLTSPGKESKSIRILSSSTADRDRVFVKERL